MGLFLRTKTWTALDNYMSNFELPSFPAINNRLLRSILPPAYSQVAIKPCTKHILKYMHFAIHFTASCYLVHSAISYWKIPNANILCAFLDNEYLYCAIKMSLSIFSISIFLCYIVHYSVNKFRDVVGSFGSYTRFGAFCWFSFAFSRVCSWYLIANQGCWRFSSPLSGSLDLANVGHVSLFASRPSHVHKFKPVDIATGEKLEAISTAVRRRTGRNAMR